MNVPRLIDQLSNLWVLRSQGQGGVTSKKGKPRSKGQVFPNTWASASPFTSMRTTRGQDHDQVGRLVKFPWPWGKVSKYYIHCLNLHKGDYSSWSTLRLVKVGVEFSWTWEFWGCLGLATNQGTTATTTGGSATLWVQRMVVTIT